MSDHRFASSIRIGVHETAEVEFAATVIYARHKGYAGDRTDPPEADTVELIDIIISIPGREPCKLGAPALLDAMNDALQADMLEDWAVDHADAEERRAESRRDNLLTERF
jgi:hypothetical protein